MADPVVKLQSGSIRGVVTKHEDGFDYYSFKGIPYAEAPVGELRFKDPIKKKKWTGIIDCKNYGPICLQYDLYLDETSIDEDCLYLNVFTRSINEPNVKRPVIVIIHGGSYMFGSGNSIYYGPEYLIRKNIILVTFNYRVGVLGFLNLEDKIAPGNQGLKDQVMALYWVQQNIQHFGGDPNNVTAYGSFTGASCAHYLAVSPLAKGLVHKIISQGSCLYNPWTYIPNPKSNAIKLCSLLGEKLADSQEILTFLMSVDTIRLQEAQEVLRKFLDGLPFGPGIDKNAVNPFMPVDREIAANKGVHIPYLIGYCSRPGILLLIDSFSFPRLSREETFKMFDEDFKQIFKYNTVDILHRHNLNEQQVRRLYFKSKKVSNENIDNYLDFFDDFYFIEGVHKLARTQSEKSSASTYMYVFEYDSPNAPSKIILKDVPNGATFGDDVTHLSKMQLFEKIGLEHWQKGTKDYRIMEQMTEMWANFVTYGRPTIQTSELIPIHWKPITNGTLLRYLSIDEDMTMKLCVNVDQKLSSAKDIKI